MKDPATKPPARIWHKMACDSDRNAVVLFGGFNHKKIIAFLKNIGLYGFKPVSLNPSQIFISKQIIPIEHNRDF
jgi:hypothetical protein